MRKIIAIVGQTATGKSNLAVSLAQEFDGEVVSADSRQVYEGLDIGSAKILPHEMLGIPHHLINLVKPEHPFSVADFKLHADQAIKDISERNHLPIIAGGTGMYVDTVVNNMSYPEVPPNLEFRKSLEDQPTGELFSILTEQDPARAANMDPNNRPRIIRALEIIEKLGSVPPLRGEKKYDCLYIGLELSDEELRNRIRERTEKRLADRSLIIEIDTLLEQGVNPDWLKSLGLEYRFVTQHVLNEINHDSMVSMLNTKTWQYARRQRTWFKRNKDIKWFDAADAESRSKIAKMVEDFLK